jgi:hypothetical protein
MYYGMYYGITYVLRYYGRQTTAFVHTGQERIGEHVNGSSDQLKNEYDGHIIRPSCSCWIRPRRIPVEILTIAILRKKEVCGYMNSKLFGKMNNNYVMKTDGTYFIRG